MFFLCIGLIFVCIAGVLFVGEVFFITFSHRTQGKVVALEEVKFESDDAFPSPGQTPHPSTYAPVFTFQDKAHKEHRVRSDYSSSAAVYQVGETVEVLYGIWSPEKAQLRGFGPQWFGSLASLFLGLMTALMGRVFIGMSRVG